MAVQLTTLRPHEHITQHTMSTGSSSLEQRPTQQADALVWIDCEVLFTTSVAGKTTN